MTDSPFSPSSGLMRRALNVIRTGEVDSDDVAVITAALGVSALIGALIGWAAMALIHAANAASLGAM